MYGKQRIEKLSHKEIKSEIERVIKFLSTQPQHSHQLPADSIHFQKQVDYVYLDGDRMVNTLYTVDQVNKLLQDVSKQVGQDLTDKHESAKPTNQSVVHRSELLRLLIGNTGPFNRAISKVLPRSTKDALRSLIYVPRSQRLDTVFDSDYVRDFIRHYYKDDIQLWNEVTSNR